MVMNNKLKYFGKITEKGYWPVIASRGSFALFENRWWWVVVATFLAGITAFCLQKIKICPDLRCCYVSFQS
jgi:hypothetical protein